MENCLNNSSHQIKEHFFFSKVKKNKDTWSLHRRHFAMYIARNPRVSLKSTQKTLKYPNNREITVTLPGDFNELEKQPTGNVLQNGCSEKLRKFPGKHPW